MSVYIPNEGEKEGLKAILLQQAMVVGLFKNQVIPDGNTVFATLEEMPIGGGRGYEPKVLTNDLNLGAAAADRWAMVVNSAGKAEAVYDDATQDWIFQTADVADGNTVYGVFGYTLVLPFTAGLRPIKVGDVIVKGGVAAIVTGVNVTSGSWAAGTAAGNLYIKNQSAAFTAGALTLLSNPNTGEARALAATPTVAGTGYAVGDLFHITTGGTGAVGRVTAVTAGVPTAVELVTGGDGYTAAAGKATAKITGSGNDALTVEISYLAPATNATIATIAGDSNKILLFVEALSTPILITTLGQKIGYTPKFTLSTG